MRSTLLRVLAVRLLAALRARVVLDFALARVLLVLPLEDRRRDPVEPELRDEPAERALDRPVLAAERARPEVEL